ncbi:unnamed protein product [Parascedosporium putredinis]|uniref:Secreted protein n=1 Tax=Parascedosporium putredinis TaxID=1442378 RepID=A0A9P1GYR1_9PEZI|nr:unnamed protein product [Parascedosporium putredinis]CAI7991007.1 unnamed protein product [Parascedosporium putredinis]
MSFLRTAFASLYLAAAASALTLSDWNSSGNSCGSVTWNGNADKPVFYFEGFDATLSAGQSANCAVHLQFASGRPGYRLVLDEVSTWGNLRLDAGGAATFFTTSFWSESAADTANDRLESATRSAFTGDVAIDATSLSLASGCVGASGAGGILNVNFRVVAEDGTVRFGPEKGSKKAAVSQHLALKWVAC